MDSARDFDLLGESVPQVRVSARTLALLGFFNFSFILTPFFPRNIVIIIIIIIIIIINQMGLGEILNWRKEREAMCKPTGKNANPHQDLYVGWLIC